MKSVFRQTLLFSVACGSALAASISAGEAAEKLVVHRDVPYVDGGNVKQHADIYIPPGEGPFPAVLMIHGGAWASGSKGHMLAHARAVVEAGYTVVSINYRLAPKHPFPAQLEDCLAALQWMRTNAKKYKIDICRIATYGYSAGGHLACLLAMSNGDHGGEFKAEGDGAGSKDEQDDTRVRCVVAGGAPCDFRNIPEDEEFFVYWLGGTRAEKPDVYQLASPVSFVSDDDPPVFFFHGEKDRVVPRRNPQILERALKDRGIKTDFYLLPGRGHIGTFLDQRPPEKAVEFLDAVLKGK